MRARSSVSRRWGSPGNRPSPPFRKTASMRIKPWTRCSEDDHHAYLSIVSCPLSTVSCHPLIIHLQFMPTFLHLALLAALLLSAHCLRLFMIGGKSYEDSLLFNDLAAAVAGRQPMPGQCVDDWSITKCPRIAVITSSHETEAEGNATYSEDDQVSLSYEHIFQQFGMVPRHVSVHADNYQETATPETARGRANLQLIQTADILYLTGGDQSKHSRAWLNDDGSESPLLAVIRQRAFNDQVIVAGSSAGSMMYDSHTYGGGSPYGVLYFAKSDGLAPKTVSDASVNGTSFADDRNGTDCLQFRENGGKIPGFKWIDGIIFETHFHAWGRMGRIVPFLVDLQRPLGIGLDENTSFFYENGQGKVYGEHGITIMDISEAIKYEGKYFRLENIRVHYLTEGDKFDFRTKTVTSSKPLITTPQYKNSTDSENILSAYQCSLLLTRIADQTPLFNRGRTAIPNGYPQDSPVFEFTFSRNAQTKGYRRGSSYTVINAVIDYSYLSAGHKHNLSQE